MILRFQNSEALWLFAPLALFLGYLLWRRSNAPERFNRSRFGIIALTLTALIFGLSRPQGGTQVVTQVGKQSSLFIAVDISKSMLAKDTLPSRLDFTIALLQRLLRELTQVRVALFVFTMDGYLLMPLTNDLMAANDFLTNLSPSILTIQGTDLTSSLKTLRLKIREAEELSAIRDSDWTTPQILLLSDGESHVELNKDILKELGRSHIPVYTVGIGSKQGANIAVEQPTNDTTFFRTPTFKTVLTQSNFENLRQISQITGGEFFSGTMESISPLVKTVSRSMQLSRLQTSFKVEHEYFPLFFAIAFTLFLIDFMKGRWEFAIRALSFFLLLSSTNAFAKDSFELEKNATTLYNQGVEQMQRGAFEKASEAFQQSVYLSQNKELQKKSLFNLGNSLLKAGEPGEALQAYQQAYDTLTGKSEFDEETNKRISENIVLAAKMEEMQKQQAEKQQGQNGDGNKKSDTGEGADPKGPKKYQAETMSEEMKKKIYELVSSEERDGMSRIQDHRNKGKPPQGKKPW